MCDNDVPRGGLVEVAEKGPVEGGLLPETIFILAVLEDPEYGHPALQ